MSIRWIVVGLIVLIILVAVEYITTRSQPSAILQISTPSSGTSSHTVTSTPTTTPTLYYPMVGYPERLTNRHYGSQITAADSKNIPCGAPFTGIHDGDDTEVTSDELSKDMPVYAIADGTVRQVGQVNGYGGLLVIQHILNGQTVTANYGHINLSRTSVKVGDTVKAGQLVTYLGAACSSQTDGERKHLHFAIHRGTAIDVKGYVQSTGELKNWLNPLQTLQNLGATEPI